MRRSKAVSALAIVAGAALALSGCASSSTTGGNSGSSGNLNNDPGKIGATDQVYHRPQVGDAGAITVAFEEGFHQYNGLTGANKSLANLRALSVSMPSPYVTVYSGGKEVIQVDGDLMDSIKVTSASPQAIEYKVKKEAVWSDGAPIDCKDFYLAWLSATAKDDKGIAGNLFDRDPTSYKPMKRPECADGGKTITTTYSEPFADYRGQFSLPGDEYLLPAHVMEKALGIPDITKLDSANPADADMIKKAADFYQHRWNDFDPTLNPSGGPYKIESTDSKNLTTLVRNDKYWAAKGGPAKITEKTVTNAQAAAQALQNKEVQVMDIQPDGSVAQQLKGVSGVKTFAQGGGTFEHIDFNMDKPLFKNHPELRKAVAQCVNRQELIDALIKDVDPNAKPLGNLMLMPNEQGYEDHYSDVGNGKSDDAKKTLTDAGWTLGPDGVFSKGSERASFKLGYKTLQRRNDTWRLVSADCKKAGIDIGPMQADNFNSKLLTASEFDAALFAWVGNPIKSSQYGNYAAKARGGTGNYGDYDSTKMEAAFADANKDLNYTDRLQKLNEVDKIIHDDYFSIPLFQLPDYAAYDQGISPINYVGPSGGSIWNAYEWQKK